MRREFRPAARLALLAFGVAAMARGQALVSFTGGTLFGTYQADGDTIGWSFTTNQRFVVTHLGYWDGDGATQPLTLPHPVGLWTAAGNLVDQAVVQATSPPTLLWRYVQASSFVLAPGTYHLGAFVAGTNPTADGYMASTSSRTMSPGFTMGESLRDPDGAQTGLVFPSVTSAVGGRYGPNLLYATPAPGIELAMTVATDLRSYSCGAETAFALPTGTDLVACYEVTNSGNAALTRHDLVDSRLGVVLADFPYTLSPGAAAFLTQRTTSPSAVGWSSTWTSYNPGPFEQVSGGDGLGVVVLPPAVRCNGRTLTFSSGFPPGITSYDAIAQEDFSDGSTDFWNLGSCGEAQNWTGARGGVACASSDLAPAGAYDTQLRTHAIDLSAAASARIEFTINYQRAADTLVLEASTNGGLTWQSVQSFPVDLGPFRAIGGVRGSASLAAFLGQSAVKLRWRYENPAAGASDEYVQIDNIALTCGAGIFFDGFESGDDHAWSSASS